MRQVEDAIEGLPEHIKTAYRHWDRLDTEWYLTSKLASGTPFYKPFLRARRSKLSRRLAVKTYKASRDLLFLVVEHARS